MPLPEQELFYYSAADLAKRYRVHLITIFKWAKTGILPPGEHIGPNTTRWRSDKIAAHEATRPHGRRRG